MTGFEELVKGCDRLWLNCRCTRLRLPAVQKQEQRENQEKAAALKKIGKRSCGMPQKIWRKQGGRRKWTGVSLLCCEVNLF